MAMTAIHAIHRFLFAVMSLGLLHSALNMTDYKVEAIPRSAYVLASAVLVVWR